MTSQVDSISGSLLQGLRDGEAEAWSRFVRIYSPLVYGWCRRANLQPEDASDIAQEVFSSVHRRVIQFQYQPGQGTFRAWLATITHNKIRDYYRRTQRNIPSFGGSDFLRQVSEVAQSSESSPKHESSSANSSASTEPTGTWNQPSQALDPSMEMAGDWRIEEARAVQRAALQIQANCDPKTWNMFWKTTIEGNTPADVAKELGASVASVYQARSRVLQRLRKLLDGLTPRASRE